MHLSKSTGKNGTGSSLIISQEHTGTRERLKLITGSGYRSLFLCIGEDGSHEERK